MHLLSKFELKIPPSLNPNKPSNSLPFVHYELLIDTLSEFNWSGLVSNHFSHTNIVVFIWNWKGSSIIIIGWLNLPHSTLAFIGIRHQTVSNSSIPPLSKESFPFLFLPKTKPETKGLTKKKLLANENQVDSFQKENKWMKRF